MRAANFGFILKLKLSDLCRDIFVTGAVPVRNKTSVDLFVF